MSLPTMQEPHSMPCPWCGEAEGYVTDVGDEGGWIAHAVRCGNCGAFGPWAGDEKTAVKCWEERKEPKNDRAN